MGNTPAKQNTENWNNINTEDVSSTIPYMEGMDKESKDLKNMLSRYLMTDTDTDSTDSESEVFMKKYINTNINSESESPMEKEMKTEDLSATSPFITSDMYNKMVNEENKMEGGGVNDSSSTSTTSEFKNKNMPKMNDSNKTTESVMVDTASETQEKITTENTMTGGEFSYQSSSAHTSGSASEESGKIESTVVEDNTDSKTEVDTDESDKSDESDKKISTESSIVESTIANEDSNMTTEKSSENVEDSSSINTSDINMVTVDN